MFPQKDLQFLSAAVPEVEHYLQSNVLYYPLGNHLPQLTLGSILLSLARTGQAALQFERQVDSLRSKWKTAWETKAEREMRARGELWMQYLTEYRSDPMAGSRVFAYNVRYRTMLGLLGNNFHESDTYLRSVFKTGEFIWEPECAHNFQRVEFWYLYGTLQER